MKKELQRKLREAFPFMKRRRLSEGEDWRGSEPYNVWGIEVGDGWFQLLYDLCSEIMALHEKHKMPLRIRIDDIKEKYGGLRFYYGFNVSEQEDELYYDKDGHPSESFNALAEEIDEVVTNYEDKSETVCERCGEPGKLRCYNKWELTRCNPCYEEYVKEREAMEKRMEEERKELEQ